MAVINNDKSNTLLSGTSGDDTIRNGGYWDDDDHDGGSNVTINSGEGRDFVDNRASNVTINTGSGNDDIYNDLYSDYAKINTGVGNDSVDNYGDLVTINTGADNDYVINGGSKVTIIGGKGNDSIFNACWLRYDGQMIYYNIDKGRNIIFKYASGDGNDIIYGFKSDSTLSIGGGSYSTTKSGDNIIVTVGDGKISLMGAASLSSVHIDGTEEVIETNSWKLDGTTATYGTSSSTLIKLTNIKSLAGVSLSGNVVTIAKSAVNAKKITLTGTGYTLALNSDVSQPTTKKAAWTVKNSTATYKSSYKTAGYTLAKNSKSITYSKATTAETLATINGVKSKTGLSVSGKKITLKNSALNKKVTVSGGYEFNFAADYKNATITGSSNADSITTRGANISINAGAGADTIQLFSKSTVTGGEGADTFIYNKGNVVIADYEAEDTISIASGTAVTSTSDNNLILTVGTSKITITGGNDGKKVTYYDDGGTHTYQKASDTLEGVKFTKSGKVVTLTDDYEADKFDVADFSNYKSKIITINAAKVSQALEIIGNKKSNVITGTSTDDYIDGGAGADSIKGGNGNDKIYGGDGNDSILGGIGSDTLSGGAGNDSLWGGVGSDSIYGGLGDDYLVGGEGRDIFVYNNGDGHDYIDDYQQGVDKIMILSGEKPYIDRTNLSNDVTYIIGEGSLVVKNGINTTIEFVDSNNKLIDKSTPSTAG